MIECSSTIGVDRNLRNLTTASEEETRHYDLSDSVRIVRTTTCILSSLKRNDVRIRQAVTSKYGRRRHNRVNHQLHNATKTIVEVAVERREMIVLEDIRGIRRLYQKGERSGPLLSWPVELLVFRRGSATDRVQGPMDRSSSNPSIQT